MKALLIFLASNEVYWGLHLAALGEGWARSARRRLGKLRGKHPENIGGRND